MQNVRLLLCVAMMVLGGCSAAEQGSSARLRASGPYARAAVAADHHLASQAGAQILAAGGNAVDAAVATSLALSVVRPYSCGIGGGGFMLIALPDDPKSGKVVTALDYRETAPASVHSGYYVDGSKSSVQGGSAVGVPGTIAGLLQAQERFGLLPREQVFEPAIRLADEGFAVDAHYAMVASGLIARFEKEPSLQQRFAFVWTRMLGEGAIAVGDIVRLPEQAAALRLIATEGPSAFYEGEIARGIVHAVRKDGGDMTLADVRLYRPVEREPLRVRVAGAEFLAMPPPSSGGTTMLHALQVLEGTGYDIRSGEWSDVTVHLMVEAMKYAFADRAQWLGDPGFASVPTAWLVEAQRARERGLGIDRDHTRTAAEYGRGAPMPDDGGTSHLSAVDQWGGAVACTETINLEFGSWVAVDQFGFILNNEMDDFATRPNEPNAFGLIQSDRNAPAPGKRPLSSMSPTIVLDDQGVFAVAGASGGPRIISATMQVLMRAMAGATAADAVAAARLHHQWMPDRIHMEQGWENEDLLRAGLAQRGHQVVEATGEASVQLIVRSPQGWDAASDPRKGGRPSGF